MCQQVQSLQRAEGEEYHGHILLMNINSDVGNFTDGVKQNNHDRTNQLLLTDYNNETNSASNCHPDFL